MDIGFHRMEEIMKKQMMGLWLSLMVLFSFLYQVTYTQADLLQIASQEEGESGLTASAMNQKKVYLTFDDGPSRSTDKILDILKKNNVKATFFVVGKNTEKAKRRYQRIVLEGHTLGMHSFSHNYDKIYSSVDAFSEDLESLEKYLYDVTDVRPFAYRFPGGSSNTCAGDIKPYINYINEKGWIYFDWNAESGDALDFNVGSDTLNANVLKSIRSQNTSIVLMHDLHEATNTVNGLDSLIKTLKKEGYQILPITRNTKRIQHVSVDK